MGEINLFGPLGRDYCVWFYILSVLSFISLAVLLIVGIYMGVTKRSGIQYYLSIVYVALIYFFMYFQNRLLHTMCLNSVKM